MRLVHERATLILVGLGLTMLNSCFQPKAGVTTQSSIGNKTIEEGQDTKLQISEGALAGTEVEFPAGSLAIGTNVSVSETTTPDLFSEINNVSTASSALSVTATDANGDFIADAGSAMTLRIPIVIPEEAAGLVDVEKTAENLCVFLDADDEVFYVFRPGAFEISENYAIIQSTKFGIFQAFFCGDEFIDEAVNAAEAGIAGQFNSAGGDTTGGGGGDADTTAPASPTLVQDGDRHGDSTSSPAISWGAVSDSDLDFYEVAIGSAAGQSDIKAWTAVGNVTSHSFSGLTLTDGMMLYASVRAVDKSGNKSTKTNGDGWQQLECPANYVKVAGNTTANLGGSNYSEGTKTIHSWSGVTAKTRSISDFCVMKHEARNNGGVSADPSDTTMYVSITRSDAATQCGGIAASHYYLMQNNFWQALARDIESVDDNWVDGDNSDSGTGPNELYSGHTGGTTCTDDTNPIVDGSCVSQSTPESATRTHTLSTGDVIWDLAGNVAEWVADEGVTGFTTAGNVSDSSADALNFGPVTDYSSYSMWTSGGGLGQLFVNASNGITRGGSRSARNGVFTAEIVDPTNPNGTIGFRCMYAP